MEVMRDKQPRTTAEKCPPWLDALTYVNYNIIKQTM